MPKLINTIRKLGSTKLRAQLVAVLAGIFFIIPAGSYYTRDHHGLGQRSQDAARDIRLRVTLVEMLVKQAMLAPGLLMTTQAVPVDLGRLDAAAWSIFQSQGTISRLEVTPSGKPGISFRRDATTRNPDAATGFVAGHWQADQTPQGTLETTGYPIISISNDSITAKQSIQLRQGRSKPEFWGHASSTVKVADLLKALRFDELAEQGYALSIDYFRSDALDSIAILSVGGSLRDGSFNHDIRFPQGDRILLRASPPPGWDAPPITLAELMLLFIGGSVISLLAYQVLRRPAEVRNAVAARTVQMALDMEALESEVQQRKQAEASLQNSHALLDSIFEHIPSMIILKRASDLRVVRVNRFGETVLGLPKAMLLGRSSKDLFQGVQADRDAETDLAAIHENTLVELPEQFIQMPGGSARWIKIKKVALLDAEGKPSHILEIGEDITAHKHLDEALTENLNFVEQLLAAIPTPVFFKDLSGCFVGANKAFEAFYGTSADGLIGKTIYDIAPQQHADVYDQADRELLEMGGKQSYEARVECRDGTQRDVVFFKAVFSTTHAETGGIVGVMLDISEQKAAERHILRLNRTLAVVSETNQAILRTKDCHTLIQSTVDIFHETGGFPLAWVYASNDELPAMVVIGEHAELAASFTAALRTQASPGESGTAATESGRCRFFPSLRDCDNSLPEIPRGFESHGLAHLPLRIAGKLAGGICIVGPAEGLCDEKEQSLLASLAENLSHAIDSIEQERARQVAERKLELASHVFENSAEGVMITDSNNKILMVNRRFSEITGYTAEEVAGNTPNMLNSGQQDKSFYSNMWRSLMNRGEWHGEIRNRRKDGEIVVEWLNISAVKDESGEIINYVAVFSEITVHKTIKKRMQFLAHYDVLTSLPNRSLFSDRLEQTIIAARRNNRSAALMFIDLDHFDQINKAMGHAAGDLLLQEVSARLLASVDPGNSVSRLGGDEFAIALSDIDSPDQAAAAAKRVQRELSRPIYIDNTELCITASIGIGMFPKDGDDAETLSKSADAAMYLSAEAGGNTYRFFNSQTNDRLSGQIKLRDRLHRAIERDELKVFYQPLLSGETGRIVGAEALLRWFRPEAGYISPAVFVPVLEESGLVVKVGDWVLRTALADNIAWRKEFDSDLFVAVNFSAGQLADGRLVEKVGITMEELGFDARHLHLEMSESTIMRDAPTGLGLLHRLKDLGVTLSIDDVGTGYSSLSYLNRFPIDTLKIDRSFIQDTPNDAEAVAITRTIIAMGHALKLKIVASGVETTGQVNFLRQARCDILQGYKFSKAVSAEEFSSLLRENNGTDPLFLKSESIERLHLVG